MQIYSILVPKQIQMKESIPANNRQTGRHSGSSKDTSSICVFTFQWMRVYVIILCTKLKINRQRHSRQPRTSNLNAVETYYLSSVDLKANIKVHISSPLSIIIIITIIRAEKVNHFEICTKLKELFPKNPYC